MRFSPEFIDRLRAQVVVSQVVGRRVALKRQGRVLQGLCPFHKEKTPSFNVNDEKGFYHCFGCGAHGDGIRFLTDYEGLAYPEAIERLANEFGVALPKITEEQVKTAKHYNDLHTVMETACQWFEEQLKTSAGKVAQDYLKSRGMTDKVAKHFRLGFAPQAWDELKKHMIRKGVSQDQLVEAGLIIIPDKGGQAYDRFRARIMFPITDRRGKVIAFGGRVIPALVEGAQGAKYLNSPETPLFKKGEVLYAFEHAREAAHKSGTVLVAEGYMDVIALYQQGIANAVAPLGTAITEHHLRLLWQLADTPVLCLDGDAAGQRAMMRAAELSLPLLKPGKNLRFLVLPKGEDPDTLVRKEGTDVFTARIQAAVPLSDIMWDYHAGKLKGSSSPEKRASVELALMKVAERIADPIIKSHFRAYFRKRLWPERKIIKGKKIKEEMQALRSRDVEFFMQSGDQAQIRRREENLLRLILQNPSLLEYADVEETLGSFPFSDLSFDKMRHVIMNSMATSSHVSRESLEKELSKSGLSQELATYFEDEKISSVLNEDYALQSWRLETQAHLLTRMEQECKMLEMEMSENVDEENYERLVMLKKQIGIVHKTVAAAQAALDRKSR